MIAKESERKEKIFSTNETQSALSESSCNNEVAVPVQFPVLRNYTHFKKIYFLESICTSKMFLMI